MVVFKTVLSESPLFLIRLYNYKDFFQELEDHNGKLYSFVQDPYHFNYKDFEAHWWPLLKLSDLGMPAMKYGRKEVIKKLSTLNEKDRIQAEKYVNLYTEKDKLDPSDIYYIPAGVKKSPPNFR